jgi:hypothetical protein
MQNFASLMDFTKDNDLKIKFGMDGDCKEFSCSLMSLEIGKRTMAEKARIRQKYEFDAEKDKYKRTGVIYMFRKTAIEREELSERREEGFFSAVTIRSLNQCTEVMSTIINNLKRPFEAMQRDLPLYKLGIGLTAYYNKRGISRCFPVILPHGGQTRYTGMVNPSADKKTHKEKKDITSAPLMNINEANDADNTAFVCGWALTQLLAQAGLPVAAESAEVAVVSGLFAQFASDEVVLGRFEEEAKQLADILDRLKPHATVMLHEIFQSTAYEEVSEPFAHIIQTLNDLNCTVILVTHNHFLVETLRAPCYNVNMT